MTITESDMELIQRRLDRLKGLVRCIHMVVRSEEFGGCLTEEPEFHLFKITIGTIEGLEEEVQCMKDRIHFADKLSK